MLFKYVLRDGTAHEIAEWSQVGDADPADLSSADLSGALELWDAARAKCVRIHSRWISRLVVDPIAPALKLRVMVDAPLPAFPDQKKTAPPWALNIEYEPARKRWFIATVIPWLRFPEKCSGYWDEWLGPKNNKIFGIKKSFPFDQLGFLSAADSKDVRIGVFVVGDGDRHEGAERLALTIACVPVLSSSNTFAELDLARLRESKLEFSVSKLRAALIAHLDAGIEGSDGEGSPWFSLFGFRAARDLGPDVLYRVVWNETHDLGAVGLRNTHAGRPWWPLPRLHGKKASVGETTERWQRIVFAAPTRRDAKVRLVRFEYGRTSKGTDPAVQTEFRWYADDSVADVDDEPAPSRTVALKGSLALPREDPGDAPQDPEAGRDIAEVINNLVLDGSDRPLIEWRVNFGSLASAPVGWLTFGSIDIQPRNAARDDQQKAFLICRLRGHWNPARCDVYPEIDFQHLPCSFRMSNSGDAPLQSLIARFDVAGRLEDLLHRPTRPAVNPLDKVLDGALTGKFYLRIRTDPHRDAVIQVRLRRDTFFASAGKSLYLQMRPFNFARLWPANFDEEAGLDFAYWRSDDPEGAQWRMPDATIEFDLPPQTVAEEMERGIRFWPPGDELKPTPYINPSEPIRYRFSPPTHLKVRPSKVERRYNKNANNLSDILDGARVEAFRTELLYPIALKFEVDSNAEPRIDIAETGSFIGQPTANLPVRARDAAGDDELPATRTLAEDVFPPDLAEWFVRQIAPPAAPPTQFTSDYDTMRWRHSANRAQFVARVAQFHVHDPYLRDRQLMLSDGLKAALRRPPDELEIPEDGIAPVGSMPPLLNPLPIGSEVESDQKAKIRAFLTKAKTWVKEEWKPDSKIFTNEHGALRAGALHTMEFPSELVAVLRNPGAVGAFIETLSFSTLGASGASAVTFDEGRTTFSVEISDGQVWRIRKIRLGRIALLWNRAKHVVVYERTVVPSLQFENQQTHKETLGWPILRKTEEYVEPIEMLRVFSEEADADKASAGFAHASEFVTPRIYVDGAWGRDLKHGYEIPLWNPADTSGFYPKPQAAISTHAGAGERSRAWHEHPEELYFYSNTQEGTGADSNAWQPFHGVDLVASGVTRLPQLTNRKLSTDQVLDDSRLPSPRPGGLRRKRFDLLVRSDGPVNLQHERGDTQMLAAGVDMLSFGRTAATSPIVLDPESEKTDVGKALVAVQGLNAYAGKVDSLRDQAQGFLEDLPELYFKYRLAGCATLSAELHARAKEFFEQLRARARNAFTKVPEVDLQLDADVLKQSLREELLEKTLPPLIAFRSVVKEMREQLEFATHYTEVELGDDALRAEVRKRLDAIYEVGRQVIATAQKKVEDALVRPFERIAGEIADLAVTLEQLQQHVTQMLASEGEAFRSKAKEVKAIADAALDAVQRIHAPQLAPLLQRVAAAAQTIGQIAEEGAQIADDEVIKKLVPRITALLQAVAAALKELGKFLVEIPSALSSDAVKLLYEGWKPLRDDIDAMLMQPWNDGETARKRIASLFGNFKTGLNENAALIEGNYHKWRDGLANLIDKKVNCPDEHHKKALIDCLCDSINNLTRPVAMLCNDFRGAILEFVQRLSSELQVLEDTTLDLIEELSDDCLAGQEAMDRKFAEIAAKAREFAAGVEKKITGVVTSIVDEATVQRMAAWSKDLEGYKDIAGKSIKLAKAIGGLPELPHLKFNADRVEYVFDDLKKQIETSPFAARMREIDSGLKELGLAVPVRQLLDQLVPDNSPVDFNKVFRDFGGIDFRKLFSKFKIPGIDKDHIKVTHGIDKTTRSAWIKAKVFTSYPQPQDLFAAGPLVVRTAAMAMQAESDVRITLDGHRKVETTGMLRADWSLEFKGAKLVAFRDTTVTLEGGKFDFNIAPEKVELHPSLKFVSEIAKKLGEKIPPCLELVRDSRGVIVGARANLSTVIKNPPSLGVVKIGPLTLVGGLSLTLEDGYKFAVSGHMSVGTKTAPIFVQINFLGGGMWLDAEARFVDGKVTYLGNVGLALGSTEAFNIGGVARGSYSLLLFAYASFKSGGGGSLRAGLSIQGCARVLGIVNAYLMLLLEVIHGEGKSRGNGLLDVEIEIGRWYSISVHKQVERSL